MTAFMKRVRILGVAFAMAGLAVAAGGFLYGMPKANDGLTSAQQMYEAQGVKLKYNDGGELVSRGDPERAKEILALLAEEWRYPIDAANFDPDDPLVNTRDELMYQYATITYDILHRNVAVNLAEGDVPLSYRGVTYDKAGTYNVTVAKYYAELDRSHPIERQLRAAWTPEVLGLTAALAGGHANQAAGELAAATSLGIGSIGLLFTFAGAGLVWASFGNLEPVSVARPREASKAPEPVGVLLQR